MTVWAESPVGKVVVVGSINVDLVVTADRFPRPGETLIGIRLPGIPEGKGRTRPSHRRGIGARTLISAWSARTRLGSSCASPVPARRRYRPGSRHFRRADRHGGDHCRRGRKQHRRGRRGQRNPHYRGSRAADRGRRYRPCATGGPIYFMDRGVQGGARRRGHNDVNAAPANAEIGEFLTLCDVVVVNEIELGFCPADRSWTPPTPRPFWKRCGRSAKPRTKSSLRRAANLGFICPRPRRPIEVRGTRSR